MRISSTFISSFDSDSFLIKLNFCCWTECAGERFCQRLSGTRYWQRLLLMCSIFKAHLISIDYAPLPIFNTYVHTTIKCPTLGGYIISSCKTVRAVTPLKQLSSGPSVPWGGTCSAKKAALVLVPISSLKKAKVDFLFSYMQLWYLKTSKNQNYLSI